MNAEPVELRRPLATVTWPFGPVSADSVTVEAAVNRNTRVSFTAFSGSEAGEAANRVLSDEACALMGRAQTQAYSRRDSPDCTVALEDGDGKRLNLRGFMVGPAYTMGRGTLSPSFSFLAETAALANLKLDIYTTTVPEKAAEVGVLMATAGNLAARLRQITEMMIAHWQRSRAAEPSTQTLEIADQRHAINLAGPLRHWYELLDNSVESLQTDWMKKLQDNSAFNSKFNGELQDILRGPSRDFLDVIEALMGAFQLLMIPGRDGAPGRLIPIADTVTVAATDLVLPATTLVLKSSTGTDLLPVQQVLMRGTPTVALEVASSGRADLVAGGYIMGGFPTAPASASGEVVIETLPFYMERIIPWIGEALGPARPGSGAPDLAKLDRRISQLVVKARTYQSDALNRLVLEHCRNAYVNRALGGSGATVQVPASLALWPGERYRVINSRGAHLFTGFLAGVTHTFTKGGSGGNASTSLNFSHILFPGFTLPGF